MALVALLAGCSQAYTCPDPIGPIVRDDCDVYATRYDALKVDLNLTFAGIGVGAKVGDEAVREPSELIQVLRLQTEALCRDHNACRVSPADYRRRREALDQRYASITGLNSAIRDAPDAATRGRLTDQLIALMQTPIEGAPPPATTPRKAIDPFRNGTMVWLGSQLAPPRTEGPRAVPTLAGWRFTVSKGHRPASYAFLRFRGPVARDDFAFVTLPDGRQARCAVRPLPAKPERGQGGSARCVFEGAAPWPTAGQAQVAYTPGLTGARAELGALPLAPADRAARAWLAYLPTPVRENPVTHERPWLVFRADANRRDNLTARCTVNGEPIGGVLRSQSTSKEADGLRRFHVALPVSVPREAGAPPADADLTPITQAAGAWRCRVSVTAKPLRSIEFTLQPDGRPKVQTPQGLISPPWWPL